MPKPKRRPPIVKTDWVVEYEKIGPSGCIMTCQQAYTQETWARLSVNFVGTRKINPRTYKRTWRKVDL